MPGRIFFSRTVAPICIAADSNPYCHLIPYTDINVNIYKYCNTHFHGSTHLYSDPNARTGYWRCTDHITVVRVE